MNITNVNLVPKSAGSKAIESEGFSASEQSGNAEDFANALKGQEMLLQEPKSKDEIPAPQQTLEQPIITAEKTKNHIDNNDDNYQGLVALLEEYFPFANTKTEIHTATPDATALLAITEDLNRADDVVDNQPKGPEATQDISGLLPFTGIAVAKPAPETNQASLPAGHDKSHDPVVSLEKYSVAGQFALVNEGDNLQSENATDNFKQSLSASMGTETAVTDIKAELLPVQKPVETRVESLVIAKPVTHPGWSKDLGEHILWLNNKEISAAEIKLNPVHLGPVSIRIDINQDNQASIVFTAQHAETKEALEASVPKLREMLHGQQLNLVNVNISQNPGSHHGRPSAQPFQNASGSQDRDFEKTSQTMELTESEQVISKGLLSLYA